MLALMVPGKVNNWAFDTVPQKGLGGRVGYQPRGKGLGGSSAINAMVYIRGHRWDYDQWASHGNPGWSFSDVLPYFKRSEDNADFDGEYHGKGGPLAVNKLRTDNPVHQIFLQGAREGQFRIREDFNADEHEGLGVYQLTQKNGERWSAARAYLHPHIGSRANLRVETGRMPPASCSRASALSASNTGKARTKADPRPARGDRLLRRVPDPATPDAVGRRRRRGACKTRHRKPASSARRRAEFAGPSGFRVRIPLGQSELQRPLAGRHSAADACDQTVPARAPRADDLEFRRMRRFPENPPRPRRARHPAAFRHGDGRRPRPQAPPQHRLLAACLPAAAEEPRQRRDRQRRSVCAAPDRSELFGRAGRSRNHARGLQGDAQVAGDAGAARLAAKGHVHRGSRPTTRSASCCASASIPSITRSAPPKWAATPWRWSMRS